MKYTHRNGEMDAPEIEGYYWFEYDVRGRIIHICQVWRDTMKGQLHAKWPGVELEENVDELTGRWYGPIPEPGDGDDTK